MGFPDWFWVRIECPPGRLLIASSYSGGSISEGGLGGALAVYNHLKPGYLESVYERALERELLREGFAVRRQVRLPVYYKGELLDAHFVADMVVNDAVLVELKAVSNLSKTHERQVESYLKTTGREGRRDSSHEHDGTACDGAECGQLVNFGNLRRLEWRVV